MSSFANSYVTQQAAAYKSGTPCIPWSETGSAHGLSRDVADGKQALVCDSVAFGGNERVKRCQPDLGDPKLTKAVSDALSLEPRLTTNILASCVQTHDFFVHDDKRLLQGALLKCMHPELVRASKRSEWETAFRVADDLSTRIARKGDADLLSIGFLSLRSTLSSALSIGNPHFAKEHALAGVTDARKQLLLSLASARIPPYPGEDRDAQMAAFRLIKAARNAQVAAFRLIKAADTGSYVGVTRESADMGTDLLHHMRRDCEALTRGEIDRVLDTLRSRSRSLPAWNGGRNPSAASSAGLDSLDSGCFSDGTHTSPGSEAEKGQPGTFTDRKVEWAAYMVADMHSAACGELQGASAPPEGDGDSAGSREQERTWEAEHVSGLIKGLSPDRPERTSHRATASAPVASSWK